MRDGIQYFLIVIARLSQVSQEIFRHILSERACRDTEERELYVLRPCQRYRARTTSVRRTIQIIAGVDLPYDPFRRGGCGPRGSRATSRRKHRDRDAHGYAVVRTLWRAGMPAREIPAFSRLAGVDGAAFISKRMVSASEGGAPHALERGSTALATSAGVERVS